MRLMKPDPGELVDRQTILELKIDHANVEINPEQKEGEIPIPKQARGSSKLNQNRFIVNKEAKGTRIHLFYDELELISKKLLETWVPDIMTSQEKVDKYDELYASLSETNASLWDLEDQGRVYRAAPERYQNDPTFNTRCKDILFEIEDLNDKRADLVKQINALWGIKSQEKSY